MRALFIAGALAVLSLPQSVQASALLCTNSLALTDTAVASVADFLSADASALIVFREGLDSPEGGFDEIQIVVEADRPDILARCAEFAGLDAGLLRDFAQDLTSEIGQPIQPVPGLPGGVTLSVGRRLLDGDHDIFLQVSQGSAALELLMAIFMALGEDWGKCSTDPACYTLIDRW